MSWIKATSQLLLVLLCFCTASSSQSRSKTYGETVKLLSKASTEVPNEELKELFSTGDQRIDDLKKALNDPNKNISLKAQRILRYLGSTDAIAVLKDYFATPNLSKSFTGAIPIPIADFDYEVHQKSDWMSSEFVYALLFDNSERARSILPEISKRIGGISDGCTGAATNSLPNFKPNEPFSVSGDIADAVVQQAFFICDSDKKYVFAKLIAYNATKTKALIYLKIDRGPLAEEWYHIVVSKTGDGWRFFSVTQVAVS